MPKIKNAHFNDLERFLAFWANDPEGFVHFVGWGIGRLATHKFHDLFLAIGASYFSTQNICERIDFLYETVNKIEELSITDEKEKHPIAIVSKRKYRCTMAESRCNGEILCIHLKNDHSIMILLDVLDGLPYYSIRYFVERGEWKTAKGYLKKRWEHSSDLSIPDFDTMVKMANSGSEFEEDHTFWNFRQTDDIMHGVVVYPQSDGFSDPWETKRLAELIVQVSNLKNFDRRLT